MIEYNEYGNVKNDLLIYFHGAPGCKSELLWLNQYAEQYQLHIICFERFSLSESYDNERYFDVLTQAVESVSKGRVVSLLGFSIGAFVTTKVLSMLSIPVKSIHLVSPAAPLSLGNFLPNMAGQKIFDAAKNNSALFNIVSAFQSLLVRLSPSFMFKMVFNNLRGRDQLLSENKAFKTMLYSILVSTFIEHVRGYKRDINAYVSSEHDYLFKINKKVHLWHGEKDNWSPIEMSHKLEESLGAGSLLHILPESSHYSCLLDSLPKIFSQLTKGESELD